MNLEAPAPKFTRSPQKRAAITPSPISSQSLSAVEICLPDYLIKSGETERTIEGILEEIASAYADNFKTLWLFFDSRGDIFGFAFAEIMYSELGHKVVNIHHLYICGYDRGAIHEFDHKVGDWGREHGALEVGFYTRRDPVAFLRRIKNGWEFDSYVLKRKI